MAANEEKLVGEIENLMGEIQEIRKKAKKKSLVLLISVLLMVLVIGSITFVRIRHNFSSEVVGVQLSKKMTEISSDLHLYGQLLFNGVPESYREAFMAEMKNKLPLLQTKLMNGMDAFNQDLRAEFQKNFQAKMGDKFVAQQEQKLGKAIDPLLDPARIEQDKKYFATELQRLMDDLTSHLSGRFQSDMSKMAMVLKTFPRDHEASIDEDQSRKMFVHYWLQLVDKELMSDKGGLKL